jgi:hypothetical protein
MKLTRLQRRNLALCEHFRDNRATVWSLLWFSRKAFLVQILYFGIVIGAFYFMAGGYVAGLLALMCLSALLRDFSYMRRSAKVWPAMREVIDFGKVSEMLNANSEPQDG